MTVSFADTNIFIRYLTNDDPAKGAKCREFFHGLRDGSRTATTSEAIVAEVVYVLESKGWYALPRERVRSLVEAVVLLQGWRLPDRPVYLRALELYAEHRIDFQDALAAAHYERGGMRSIVSYDRDFDKIAGVVREEP